MDQIGGGLLSSLPGNLEAASLVSWPGGYGLFAGSTDGEMFCSLDRGERWARIAESLPPVSKCVHYGNSRKGRAAAAAAQRGHEMTTARMYLRKDITLYKGKTVIDVHGHLSTPPQFRAFAFNLVVIRDPNEQLALSAEAMKPAIERHLKMLDERGIDVQLLSPRPVAMIHWERAPVVEQWTRSTNQVIAQQCEMYPHRFIGIGQLPQTPEGNIRPGARKNSNAAYGSIGSSARS